MQLKPTQKTILFFCLTILLTGCATRSDVDHENGYNLEFNAGLCKIKDSEISYPDTKSPAISFVCTYRHSYFYDIAYPMPDRIVVKWTREAGSKVEKEVKINKDSVKVTRKGSLIVTIHEDESVTVEISDKQTEGTHKDSLY
jgi:hypothetical protein